MLSCYTPIRRHRRRDPPSSAADVLCNIALSRGAGRLFYAQSSVTSSSSFLVVVERQESSLPSLIIITKSRSCWSQHWNNWVPADRVYYYGHGCVLPLLLHPPLDGRLLFSPVSSSPTHPVPTLVRIYAILYSSVCVLYTKLFFVIFFFFVTL